MIYDHIRNINLYKGLSEAIDEGLDFIANANASMTDGVFEIDKGVKVIVSEYSTKRVNENGYEAHRRFIDIQFPLIGTERVKCVPVEYLTETKKYDSDKDYLLFAGDTRGSEFTLGNGYFLVLFPEDGHMPQLCEVEPVLIKKLTLKVPIKWNVKS